MKIRLALVTIAVIGVFFLLLEKPCANFKESSIETPIQKITVALADTPEEQGRGLGGCTMVPRNSGMYFVFSSAEERTFWMKDMRIPIDIIWLYEGAVVGIERNVPNLPGNTPDSELPTYSSPIPVDGVLEVGTGKAEEYGIQIGSKMNIDKKY